MLCSRLWILVVRALFGGTIRRECFWSRLVLMFVMRRSWGMVFSSVCSVSKVWLAVDAKWLITGFGLSLDEISIPIDWCSLNLRLCGLLLNFLNLQYSCWRWLFGGCSWGSGGFRWLICSVWLVVSIKSEMMMKDGIPSVTPVCFGGYGASSFQFSGVKSRGGINGRRKDAWSL